MVRIVKWIRMCGCHICVGMGSALYWVLPAMAESSMEMLFDEQDTVISATESRRALDQAPSIVTVITEKQIRDMGAHTLIKVLESVPGFHVSYPSDVANGYTLSVRGLKSGESENTLLMINGHRVNNPYSGSWTFLFDEFPLADVRRIEIIRGPGSALYGSNAVVAVISIITREAGDFLDDEVSVSAGNKSTQRGHISVGTHGLDNHFMLSLDEASTDGARDTVNGDSAGGSGQANFWRRQRSGYLSVTGGDWNLFAMHLTKRRGSLLDATNRIDTSTDIAIRQSFAGLSWKQDGDDWDVEWRNDADWFDLDPRWQTFGGPTYQRAPVKNLTLSGQGLLRWRGWRNHEWTTSLSYEHIRQYDVRNMINGVDVTASLNHNRNAARRVPSMVLQDEWRPAEQLALTAGMRLERYSDVGNSASPRLAAIWHASPRLDIKVMAARAFRAPNFIELYSANNPSVIGNSQVKPEVMDTLETGVSWHDDIWRLDGNAFYSRFHQRITRVAPSPVTVNVGRTDLKGVEIGLRADVQKDLYGSISYTYQQGESRNGGVKSHLADAPEHLLSASGDMPLPIAFLNYPLHLHGDVHWIGPQRRAAGDVRDPVASATLVDFAVRMADKLNGLNASLVVENVFNQRAFSPVDHPLMSDLRIFERDWMLQLSYEF